MALTIGQKSDRVLQFLRGVSQPRVANALAVFGFTQADWDEGWQLLRQATGKWLVRERPKRPDPNVVEQLDAWENRWFPITQTTLQHRYPELAEQVFLNLSQTSGLEVAISVSTFVERIRGLAKRGGEHKAAREILAQRGLDEREIQRAEGLLEKFGTVRFDDPNTVNLEQELAAREEAEAQLWNWYLEWSTIARNVIHNRNLLRAMGFLRTTSSSEDEELDEAAVDAPESLAARASQAAP